MIAIYFIGIGGIGMSALARVALAMGFNVMGSDIKTSANLQSLENEGATVFYQQNSTNIDYFLKHGNDLSNSVQQVSNNFKIERFIIVYSSAIAKNNEEYYRAAEIVQEALINQKYFNSDSASKSEMILLETSNNSDLNPQLQISLQSRAEFLATFFNDAAVAIGIAGCHGKTTTTAMVGLLLTHEDSNQEYRKNRKHVLNHERLNANRSPTIINGGLMANFDNSNVAIASLKHFVAEIDESDGTIVLFRPTVGIILNIDREHMSHYGAMENVYNAYLQYVLNIRSNGTLLINEDDLYCKTILDEILLQRHDIRIIQYSQRDLEFFLQIIEKKGIKLPFHGIYKFNAMIAVLTSIVAHNNNYVTHIQTASVLLKETDEILLDCLIRRLLDFRGVSRRFENVGQYCGITLIDDYAHHPAEILAVGDVINEQIRTKIHYGSYEGRKKADEDERNLKDCNSDKNCYCVLQPHRYSRFYSLQQDFFDAYTRLASRVTGVFAMDIDPAGEDPSEFVLQKSDQSNAYKQPNDYKEALEDFLDQKCHDATIREKITYCNSEYDLRLQLDNLISSKNLKDGDLIVFMGAGNVTNISRKLASEMDR